MGDPECRADGKGERSEMVDLVRPATQRQRSEATGTTGPCLPAGTGQNRNSWRFDQGDPVRAAAFQTAKEAVAAGQRERKTRDLRREKQEVRTKYADRFLKHSAVKNDSGA